MEMNKRNHTMATKDKRAALTQKDVAHYRKQVDALEKLITQRDEINRRISSIDETLFKALKGLDITDFVPGTKKAKKIKKAKKEKVQPIQTRSKVPLADRLISICQGGATKLQVVKALNLNTKTVEAYLYSSKIGGKVLDRRNVDGVSVWFPK